MSLAADPCQYFLSLPIEDGSCGEGGHNAVTGGALPAFGDGFNLNPASIPTIKTPLGMEGIMAIPSGGASRSDFAFTLLKGYEDVGVGLTSYNDNTFYTYNLMQALDATPGFSGLSSSVIDGSIAPSINLGSAISFGPKSLKKSIAPSVGANVRYNKARRAFDFGYGLSFNSSWLSLGWATITEQDSPSLGIQGIPSQIVSLGIKIPHIHVEYTRVSNSSSQNASYYDVAMSIFTISGRWGSFLGTLAARSFKNLNYQMVNQNLAGIQVGFSKSFVVGYFSNYIPGTHSFSAQILF